MKRTCYSNHLTPAPPLHLVYGRSSLEDGHWCLLQPRVRSPELWAGLVVAVLFLLGSALHTRVLPQRVPQQGNGFRVFCGQ